MISERRMKTAIKKYNELMCMLCCEHNTIGTRLSERTEEWNLRDMVSECQYQLDCYYEEGHNAYEALHALDDYYLTAEDLLDKQRFRTYMRMKDGVDACKKEMKALQKFISTYKKDIVGMECHQGHCSIWD